VEGEKPLVDALKHKVHILDEFQYHDTKVFLLFNVNKVDQGKLSIQLLQFQTLLVLHLY
jgi:hypothetical protein